MPTDYDTVLDVLCRRVSGIHARSALDRALDEARVDKDALKHGSLARILPRLERFLALFLPESDRAALRSELLALGTGGAVIPKSQVVPVITEPDIVAARSRAREMTLELGGRRLTAQRVATIVSELARNIVSYTPGGEIELEPDVSNGLLRITARDEGPGIRRLDAVMSGRYKSRTGLGLGLRGSQRLSNHMEIDTGEHGTTIVSEVKL